MEEKANGLTTDQKAIDNPISSLTKSQQRTFKPGAQFFNNKQPISVGV
jgi:hypothetical protein